MTGETLHLTILVTPITPHHLLPGLQEVELALC